MNLAPVLLFTYNRLKETKQTIKALQKNYLANQSELFIFSDGAKNNEAIQKVKDVREYILSIKGFKTVRVFESIENKGLANSIISGVTQIIEKYDKVIVLEDDLITSSNFLNFMNEALDYYENNKKIFSVSGYTMDLPSLNNYKKDYYLSYRASSWGWATWKDKWGNVDWEVKDYSKFKWNIVEQIKFMRGGSDMPFMLWKQMKGKIDSWAIRWCYTQFTKELLTIYPSKSKIISIGFGESATHTKKTARFDTTIDNGIKQDFYFDTKLDINKVLVDEFRKKFSVKNRLIDKIKKSEF